MKLGKTLNKIFCVGKVPIYQALNERQKFSSGIISGSTQRGQLVHTCNDCSLAHGLQYLDCCLPITFLQVQYAPQYNNHNKAYSVMHSGLYGAFWCLYCTANVICAIYETLNVYHRITRIIVNELQFVKVYVCSASEDFVSTV